MALPKGWKSGLTVAQVRTVREIERRGWVELLPVTHEKGYVRVKLPPFHPYSTKAGSQYLHRYVMMRHLGRRLGRHEHVHHKTRPDGTVAPKDTADVRDLSVMEEAEHGRFHWGKWQCCGRHVHECEDCKGAGCGECDQAGVVAR